MYGEYERIYNPIQSTGKEEEKKKIREQKGKKKGDRSDKKERKGGLRGDRPTEEGRGFFYFYF